MKDQREEHLDGHLRNLWRTKFDKTRFDVARDGDHLMAYFRCDLCIFRCMKKRNPDRESAMDNRTLGYIRRANLDAFWSRATGTVGNNRSLAGRVAASLSELDLSSGYEDKGPSPFHDDCGYKVAIAVLLDAQRQGNMENTKRMIRAERSDRLFQAGNASQVIICLLCRTTRGLQVDFKLEAPLLIGTKGSPKVSNLEWAQT